MRLHARPCWAAKFISALTFFCITTSGVSSIAGTSNDPFYALYIPPHKITQRTFDEIVHYAQLTPVNAVVLHVKTPKGNLLWPSENQLAIRLGVTTQHNGLKKHLAALKKKNIHTIAKLDVFADHLLAATFHEFSVLDRFTELPWVDANGLHWSDPGNRRVWEYNIALAKELAHIGFDEIQFDYVRFPSDGDLSLICDANLRADFSRSDTIASFLQQAHAELKPLGVSLSADIFGLTAWKRNDFGVGQVLEKMAPYLDVICPMFYPSHFPSGFLGKKSPGDFPELILEASMRSMMKRTDKPIRPWIQGFWYRPEQIVAQMDGIESAHGHSWSIWSPTGSYAISYNAMADRSGISLTRPQFYPSVVELASREDQSTSGYRTVVNYTNFREGYSILSLEAPAPGKGSRYASPLAVLATLEEGIMDRILGQRSVPFQPDAEPYTKRKLLSDMLCGDLEGDARRMRPEPVYIDWSQDCIFTSRNIPQPRLAVYTDVTQRLADGVLAAVSSERSISMASMTEEIFGVPNGSMLTPSASVSTQ